MFAFFKPSLLMASGLAFSAICLGLSQGASITGFLTILLGLAGFLVSLASFCITSMLLTQGLVTNGYSAAISTAMSLSLFLTGASFSPEWDTMAMACHGFSLALLIIAVILVLPQKLKKVSISLLVIYHFLGITTAVTSLEPPGATPSFIATNMWAYYFRHYLTFMYLNNAYHFYSPEPGPPTLLWFRIQYDDGTFRWFKIPNRQESPLQMHYQRMLSVTESTNMSSSNIPDNWDEKLQKRNLAGLAHTPQITPLNRSLSQSYMYREPSDHSKRMINSYARYISKKFAHPDGKPSVNIDTIKIYKITHGIITVQDLARDFDPLDKTLFYPYFLGTFDKTGKLLDPEDPFLYFLLPITRTMDPNQPSVLTDSLEIHAGDQKPAPAKEEAKQ